MPFVIHTGGGEEDVWDPPIGMRDHETDVVVLTLPTPLGPRVIIHDVDGTAVRMNPLGRGE